MTQINNQSYVNCQGAPVAGMWPGIFASMSKIKALTIKAFEKEQMKEALYLKYNAQ